MNHSTLFEHEQSLEFQAGAAQEFGRPKANLKN